MADYPDWTDLVQIVGADIMVPIDIQGAYIMMPVDIQAQYVNLDIDIVAQSIGNISVDLVAQSVGAIEIDIKTQSIENLTIDIEAQSVALYNAPQWEAKEGHDKTISGVASDCTFGEGVVGEYTVPTGKTLYITGAGYEIHVETKTDYDHPLYFGGKVAVASPGTTVARIGGVGGGHIPFATPLVVDAGEKAQVGMFNYSDLNCDVRCYMWGYEI